MKKVDKLVAGYVTGLWAAVAQAWVGVSPPSAFGICFISHPSDLFNWIFNKLFNTTFPLHEPSRDITLLTVVGVLIGALIASAQYKEFKFRMPRNPFDHYLNGFMVATFGLMLGYCSVHIIVGIAYGSLVAITGFAGMLVGVIVAVKYIKWSVRR